MGGRRAWPLRLAGLLGEGAERVAREVELASELPCVLAASSAAPSALALTELIRLPAR